MDEMLKNSFAVEHEHASLSVSGAGPQPRMPGCQVQPSPYSLPRSASEPDSPPVPCPECCWLGCHHCDN